jgi:hypothetical protein
MASVYEIKMKDKRVFKVVIENENQRKRMQKVIRDNKDNIEHVEYVMNSIHDINTLERLL